ncbi:hypothetical protein BJ912DRAFT_923631 [Pholiota molesta]|nr:hypothetical protein BJ912DRAFT_923631 [Pholiota molesta]
MSLNEKPLIPLDVIETIVDILATVDDQGLSSVKACALSSRSFLYFCRKRMFASVALDLPARYSFPPSPTSSQFQKLLVTAPEIVNYVRKLTIGFPDRKSEGLSAMLKTFTQLQQLTLRPNRLTVWSSVAHCLQDALFHILDLPTINYLELFNISYFPILELARCINLRCFYIESFLNPILDNISSTLHSRSIVLDEFSMGFKSIEATKDMLALEWSNAQPFFDFGHLKKYFTLSYGMDDIELSRQILKETNQLSTIDIAFQRMTNFSNFSLSEMVFCSLKSLRRIILRCGLYSTWNLLIGLPDQLKVMRQWPNVLEELEIHIQPQTLTHIVMLGIGDEWARLDESLNDSRWSSLKTVSIAIKMRKNAFETPLPFDTDFCSEFRKLHQTRFPFLSSSKYITFNFTVLIDDE